MKYRTRARLVPFALCAMGLALLFLAGCRKEEAKPETPASSPASYMNDPKFREQVAVKRKDLQAIVNERAPLVRRMEELIRAHGKDLATLQKIPEWNELHKKVVELNAKYEATRARQLKVVRERITPKGEKSIGRAASPFAAGTGVGGQGTDRPTGERGGQGTDRPTGVFK